MTTSELTQNYFIWFLIVVFTNYFFTIFSKKTKSTGKILIAVLLTVWGIITVTKNVFDFINIPSFQLPLNFELFTFSLAENLPQVLIIGGIAFYFKNRKSKKTI